MWSRQINRIRARRFGAQIVSRLPPRVLAVPGVLAANGSLLIENGGDELDLFQRIKKAPGQRHVLILISERLPVRPLQYLQALRRGLIQLLFVSPFHSYNSQQKDMLREIDNVNVLESIRVGDIIDQLNCNL